MHRLVAVSLLFVSAGWADAADDDRLGQLRSFFRSKGAPVGHLAGEFLAAADRYGLDWRLLPSLAIIETGGGRIRQGNNLFGWGRVRFPTVAYGIHTVARFMAEGRAYRGKSLSQKLGIYSPTIGYKDRVQRLMRQVGGPPAAR